MGSDEPGKEMVCTRKYSIFSSISGRLNSEEEVLVKGNGGHANIYEFFPQLFKDAVRLYPCHLILVYFRKVDGMNIFQSSKRCS